MNTMIEYTAEQEINKAGHVIHSLLFLGRKLLDQAAARIQHRHTRCPDSLKHHVPPRVWRRHSALLGLLAQQTESTGARQSESE